MATESRRVRPSESLLPAAVAFLLGIAAHAVDQALFVRARPIPFLLTAPLVATLVYHRFADPTRRQILALLAWGFLASWLAVFAVYFQAVGTELLRVMTGLEMVLYDLGLFLWFVLALAAAYAFAARNSGRRAVVALLLGPFVQATFSLLMVLLVESGLYA